MVRQISTAKIVRNTSSEFIPNEIPSATIAQSQAKGIVNLFIGLGSVDNTES